MLGHPLYQLLPKIIDFLPRIADSNPRVPVIVDVNNEFLIKSIVFISWLIMNTLSISLISL